jgi:hypothetical protein
MNTIIFILYGLIFICIWYVFNQYFKDHSKEKRQPVRVNMNAMNTNIKNWKEHFSGIDNKLSIPNIRNMVKKALGQITNEDSMKPKVEQSKQIETDMELYLIGPDKHDFYKNLQENRKKPTSITTIETNDMDSYFGTSKLQTNGIAQLL